MYNYTVCSIYGVGFNTYSNLKDATDFCAKLWNAYPRLRDDWEGYSQFGDRKFVYGTFGKCKGYIARESVR